MVNRVCGPECAKVAQPRRVPEPRGPYRLAAPGTALRATPAQGNRRKTVGARRSDRPEPTPDITVEWLNDDVPRHLEPAAQMVPDRNAQFVASLGKTQKSIAEITADVAAGSGTDLAPGKMAADIVFRTVGGSGISGRSSTISNSALLACSGLRKRSGGTKPVRRLEPGSGSGIGRTVCAMRQAGPGLV